MAEIGDAGGRATALGWDLAETGGIGEKIASIEAAIGEEHPAIQLRQVTSILHIWSFSSIRVPARG